MPKKARVPEALSALRVATEEKGFSMPSDDSTGALLRTLASSKPGGRLLELGTGTGLSTAWILDGMDTEARLISVDNDAEFQTVARKHLRDRRCEFVCGEGGEYVAGQEAGSVDFLFADTWPGKFTFLDETLALLKPGGLYLVDDLLSQPNWPEDHPSKVTLYLAEMHAREDLRVAQLDWGTGHLLATKLGE